MSAKQTQCKRGHLLTPENTVVSSLGKRRCKQCQRLGRHAPPKPKLTADESFWQRVDKSPGHGPNGDCWLWTGQPGDNGYGRVKLNGISTRTHRWAYMLAKGAIPTSGHICHTCDIRMCVNPNHLFLGTALENMRDMVAKERNWHSKITHCKYGHPYTPENVQIYHNKRTGCVTRNCKICHSRKRTKPTQAGLTN
jgi:hypothetical protein